MTATRDDRAQAISAASEKTWRMAAELEAMMNELGEVYLPIHMQKQMVKEQGNAALRELRDFSRVLGSVVGAV